MTSWLPASGAAMTVADHPRPVRGGPEVALPVLLAVCSVAPWPVANGYALRVYHLLEQLAAMWRIKLVAPLPAEGIGGFPAEVAEYIPVDLPGPGRPYPWRHDQSALRAAVQAAVAQHRPDRGLAWRGAEAVWMGTPDLPPGVADIIDCTTLDLWRGLAVQQGVRDRGRKLKELGVSAWFARRMVRTFSAVVCAGEADARWLRRVGGRASVTVVSNGVALPGVGEGDRTPDQLRLGFAGTLDFEPNVDAVGFLVGAIWPLVRAACPAAELLIAGRRPTAAIRAHDGRNGITVQADVPDMAGVLRQCRVSIAPMRSGVGVKNKVLEAWASGVPVVLTPLAVNGLEVPRGHERLIRSSARSLADAVVAMLGDGAEARRLGAEARRHVGERHTWASSASEIDRLLRAAAPDHLSRPRSAPLPAPRLKAPAGSYPRAG